jgi:hypothetical protein
VLGVGRRRFEPSELGLLGGQYVAGFGAATAFVYAVWRTWQGDAHAFPEGVRSLSIGLMNLSLVLLAAYFWPRLREANRQH